MSDINDDFFDLDALSAEAKSKRHPVKFGFRAARWQLENLYSAVDLDTIEDAQEGKISAMRAALVAGLREQADAFQVGKLNIDEISALFDNWSTRSGATPGESEASSDSSESTERPSKPTSTDSTESSSAPRFTVDLPSDTPPASF